MKVLNSSDISAIIRVISSKNENLVPFAGKGEDRRIIIKNGLKIKHKQSGLVYTVIDLLFNDSGPVILCQRPGKKLAITKDKFKYYERQ